MAKSPTGSVLGTGLDSLAIGGGAAAVVALIRQLMEARRQEKAKKRRDNPEIDPNTVVLRVGNLPSSKTAEDISVDVKPAVETKEVRPLSEGQLRDTVGRFASVDTGTQEKSAQGVVAGAGHILAAGGGVIAGYYLVSKLAERVEQNRLKRQIEAAQTEYLDLLDGRSVKNAEAFSSLFAFGGIVPDGLSKEAGIPTDIAKIVSGIPSVAKRSGSAALAAYILMTGGTAYVVKKYLEDRFGGKQKEEEPEQPTKILLKAGESVFEIPPEHMLATIGVLRDCIADSTPPGVKCASSYDYSFLDDIAGREGGPQWLLDMYAKQNGLDRSGMSDFKMPVSTMLKYNKTLSDIAKNPEKHKSAIQGRVLSMMQKNPKKWFELLGDPRNNDIVGMKVNEQIANLSNRGGFLGFLSKVPVLGGMIRSILSWYYGNTAAGRRAIAARTLGQLGVDRGMHRSILGNYDFSKPGQWSAKAGVKQAGGEKEAEWDDSLVSYISRRKTLMDTSNRDILRAIEDLKADKEAWGKGKKKKALPRKVSVEFDDTLNDLLSEEDKRKIADSLTR